MKDQSDRNVLVGSGAGKARVESAMSRSDKAGTRGRRKDVVYCELQTEEQKGQRPQLFILRRETDEVAPEH